MNDREMRPPTGPSSSAIPEPSSGKRTYQAPVVLSAEDLEAAAVNCDGGGGAGGAGKPEILACNPNLGVGS
jgi:hypothetical protein